MQIKKAITERLKQLCAESGIAYNDLATRSGVTPSTVYSMMRDERKDLSVITVKKLCDGLGISITDFFSAKIFEGLEQEIK